MLRRLSQLTILRHAQAKVLAALLVAALLGGGALGVLAASDSSEPRSGAPDAVRPARLDDDDTLDAAIGPAPDGDGDDDDGEGALAETPDPTVTPDTPGDRPDTPNDSPDTAGESPDSPDTPNAPDSPESPQTYTATFRKVRR